MVPSSEERKVEQSDKQEEVKIEEAVEPEKSIATEEEITAVETEKVAADVPVVEAVEPVVEEQPQVVKEPEAPAPSEVLLKEEAKMNNVVEPPAPAPKSAVDGAVDGGVTEEKVPKEEAKDKKVEDENAKNKEGEPKPQDNKIGLKYTYREGEGRDLLSTWNLSKQVTTLRCSMSEAHRENPVFKRS